jgi:hypothetical protein
MHSLTHPARVLLIALVLLGAGCTNPEPANNIAANGGLENARQADVTVKLRKYKPNSPSSNIPIGTMEVVNSNSNIAVVRLKVPPVPVGTYLIARDMNLNAVALMQATNTATKHFQGVTLLNGIPQMGQEVVEPGPDYTPLLDANVGPNSRRAAAQAFQAAGTAAPMIVPGQ